jgi:putative transposase
MSLCKIYIHAAFSTKNRLPLIQPNIREKLYSCLYREFSNQNCQLFLVNGLPDHVHCLFSLNPQKSVSEIIKHVKGLSSHHINSLQISPEPFAWQKGYNATSISEASLPRITRFIHQQEKFPGFSNIMDFANMTNSFFQQNDQE